MCSLMAPVGLIVARKLVFGKHLSLLQSMTRMSQQLQSNRVKVVNFIYKSFNCTRKCSSNLLLRADRSHQFGLHAGPHVLQNILCLDDLLLDVGLDLCLSEVLMSESSVGLLQ